MCKYNIGGWELGGMPGAQADPVDIFAASKRLPEFSPVAAEGEWDEAGTIFVGEHSMLCSSYGSCRPTDL